MSKFRYKNSERGTLKHATERLVDACKGRKAAAVGLRIGAQQLYKYYDDHPDNEETYMPVDIVTVLERACGDPVVTEWLALEAGCALLRLPPAGLPDAWAEDLAVVMKETADVVQQVAGDLADGRIDRPGQAIREIDEAMGAFAALRQRLAAIRDGESRS